MFKLIFIIINLAYIFFLFTTVYSCPQKKTGGAAAPSAPPVPAPLEPATLLNERTNEKIKILKSEWKGAFIF